MSWLQILWFFLLFVLFSGFFVLEGFDFGVGMSTKLLAHNSDEEDQLVATIGPHWDGNEVWLITAGGAMFASYPMWYASLFSGFYIMFFLVLLGVGVWQFDSAVYFGHDFHRDYSTAADYQKWGCVSDVGQSD